MHRTLVVFLAATVAALGYAAEQICPDPNEIAPCRCFKDEKSARLTALCQNFTDASEVSNIFNNNPQWNLQDVHIDECTMSYIPAVMMEQARFQSLNVSNSILDTLFDVPPKRTPELNLYMHKLRLLRGFEWRLFSNSSLKDFGAFDTQIISFGSSFKESMPHDVERIWFEGTGTRRITANAFENLKALQILAIRRSSIKVLSRNMFPKPWRYLKYLDFSFNQITSLPEDIFVDMPKLYIILLERNMLTTVSEKIFSRKALFGLASNPLNCDCKIKWITTSNKIDLLLMKGKCEKPDRLKGKQLEHLTKEDFSYCT